MPKTNEDRVELFRVKGKLLRVKWYCGGYSSRGRYLGVEGEDAECGNEFFTDEETQDWLEKTCKVTCPDCGRQLYQDPDGSKD